jgi:hypothetical protein
MDRAGAARGRYRRARSHPGCPGATGARLPCARRERVLWTDRLGHHPLSRGRPTGCSAPVVSFPRRSNPPRHRA